MWKKKHHQLQYDAHVSDRTARFKSKSFEVQRSKVNRAEPSTAMISTYNAIMVVKAIVTFDLLL